MRDHSLGRVLALIAAAFVVAAVGVLAVLATREESEGSDSPRAGWQRAQAMSVRRSYIAAARDGRHIYAAGGMVGESGRPLAVLQRFDSREGRWATLAPLPRALRAAEAAALGGRVYVAGGSGERGEGSRAMFVYDPATNTWTAGAPLPDVRINHQLVAHQGRIYLVGGFDDRGRERREVFVYDPRTDRWRLAGRLPRPLHAAGALSYRGEIWIVGGRERSSILRQVLIVDPRPFSVRRGPALPKPMQLLGVAEGRGQLHAVWESVYQIYDPSSGAWLQGPSLEVTRHGLALFHHDGMLFAIGGCTTALRDSPVVETLELDEARATES